MSGRPTYRATTTQQVLGVVLGMLIAIVATLLLVHWMACSQAAGAALCMGAFALPPLQLPGWCRRLHRRWLQHRLAQAERLVLSCKIRQLEEATALVYAEDRVAEIERTLHHLGRPQ